MASEPPIARQPVYRYVPDTAAYEPTDPYNGDDGRFDDGVRWTLYVAGSPQGAVAEYLRRRPKLIAYQDDLKIKLFEIDLEVSGPVTDVRDPADATAAGIPPERLRSSDDDPTARYAECRALAARVEATSVAIAYPSAALATPGWCLVTLRNRDGWLAHSSSTVAPPRLTASDVVVLPTFIA